MSVWDVLGLGKTDSVDTPAPNHEDYKYGGYGGAAFVNSLKQDQAGADNRQGYQMDWSQADQSRGQAGQSRALMQDAAGSYQGVLAGNQPSVAQQQMQAGQSAAAAQGAQLAASARGGGGNAILAQRQAQQQAAAGALQSNRDTGLLRAQEQDTARQGLAGVGSQMSAADMAQQKADATRQGLAGQQFLGQQQANDARWQAALGAREHAYDQQLSANMGEDAARMGYQGGTDQFNAGLNESAEKRHGAAAGGAGSAMGSLAMLAML